jgi:hypothetical protein
MSCSSGGDAPPNAIQAIQVSQMEYLVHALNFDLFAGRDDIEAHYKKYCNDTSQDRIYKFLLYYNVPAVRRQAATMLAEIKKADKASADRLEYIKY